MVSLLMLLCFIIFMFLGFPVALSLLVPALGYLIYYAVPLQMVASKMTYSIFSFPLLAVPLFLWTGYLLNESGITNRIFEVTKMIFRKVKGGTAYVNVGVSLIFSGMSGAALADIGGLGRLELEAMDHDGYEKSFSAFPFLNIDDY